MPGQNFTLTLVSDKTPEQIFKAVMNVRAWWSGYYAEEITGNTYKLEDEFIFRAGAGAHYTKHKLIEMLPGKKIVWLVTDSNLSFAAKHDEWTGTKIIFAIETKEGQTALTFTHEGLTPQVECYGACAPAWTQYLENKLLPLINAG